jgi:hypothetical protein
MSDEYDKTAPVEILKDAVFLKTSLDEKINNSLLTIDDMPRVMNMCLVLDNALYSIRQIEHGAQEAKNESDNTLRAEIHAELDEKGKPAFSNESKRTAEFNMRVADLANYDELLSAISDTEKVRVEISNISTWYGRLWTFLRLLNK